MRTGLASLVLTSIGFFSIDSALANDRFEFVGNEWIGDCDESTINFETPQQFVDADGRTHAPFAITFLDEFLAESDGAGRVRRYCEGRIRTRVPANMYCSVAEMVYQGNYEKSGRTSRVYGSLWFDYAGYTESAAMQIGTEEFGEVNLRKSFRMRELECLPYPSYITMRSSIKLVANSRDGDYASIGIDRGSGHVKYSVSCWPCFD